MNIDLQKLREYISAYGSQRRFAFKIQIEYTKLFRMLHGKLRIESSMQKILDGLNEGYMVGKFEIKPVKKVTLKDFIKKK